MNYFAGTSFFGKTVDKIPAAIARLALTMLLFGQPSQALLAQAETPQTLMEQANRHYESGDFEAAALAYEAMVSDGVQNGVLLFNLGNAYFKQGDIGRAILNYERAALLIPRDQDLRANLALAQSATADRYESQRDSLLGQLAQLSARWLSNSELALIGLLLWIIVAALWILHRRLSARQPSQPSARQAGRHEATWMPLIAALVLLILVVGLWSIRTYTDSTRGGAIVLAQEVDVLSGPGEQYVTEFTLHSGAKVSVLESRDAWHRLALPGDELQGWVPAEALGLVRVE